MINRWNLLATIWWKKISYNWFRWVYHNSELWLISLSNDWEEWITMSDDVVWWGGFMANNLFQRGNNYAFTNSGTIQTSSTKVSASNYWPYYYDNKLYSYYGREYPLNNNLNLRWWVTWTSLAMKWPCSEWYHIPTKDEMASLDTIMMAIWATYWPAWTSWSYYYYLKMPYSWWLTEYVWQWQINQRWIYWKYWTTTAEYYESQYYWTNLYFNQLWFYQNWHGVSLMSWWEGSNIRPFKNTPVSPDSTWTIIYDWSGHAENAWIFWNESLWLISLSNDWETRVTIADKNLWATQVRNYWDDLTSENCWWYFERWNNYMFPFSWECETDTSITVDASNYWPYYSSSTYITVESGEKERETSWNRNMRWWVTGTMEAMRWPCQEWYHVPSSAEWKRVLFFLWIEEWTVTSEVASNLSNALKLYNSWYRMEWWSSTTYYNSLSLLRTSDYWCCFKLQIRWNSSKIYIDDESHGRNLDIATNQAWIPIRPFKNEPVVPDNTREKLL